MYPQEKFNSSTAKQVDIFVAMLLSCAGMYLAVTLQSLFGVTFCSALALLSTMFLLHIAASELNPFMLYALATYKFRAINLSEAEIRLALQWEAYTAAGFYDLLMQRREQSQSECRQLLQAEQIDYSLLLQKLTDAVPLETRRDIDYFIQERKHQEHLLKWLEARRKGECRS
jgi:hypothetical protein